MNDRTREARRLLGEIRYWQVCAEQAAIERRIMETARGNQP